jgi:hypothetical protein
MKWAEKVVDNGVEDTRIKRFSTEWREKTWKT